MCIVPRFSATVMVGSSTEQDMVDSIVEGIIKVLGVGKQND